MRKDLWFLLLVCLAFFSATPFVVSRKSQMLWMRTADHRQMIKLPPTTQRPASADAVAAVTSKNASIVPMELPVFNETAIYRPPASLSTLHYNFSAEVMPDEFLGHLQHMVRKISKKWKSSGWERRYGSVNIDACDNETPECSMFRAVTGPADGPDVHKHAYTKCCVEHRLLRDVAVWTLTKLNEANVTYFLSTGTALGAIRHHGVIIPWDTDVDIAIFPRDKQKVEAIFKNNGEHHFHKDTLGKPMFWVHHSKTGKPPDGPHVEIFYDAVYTSYPSKLLPLEPCNMYGRVVKCPNRNMFSVWFPSGWGVYGGGHYHGPNRCTVYRNGKRYEQDKC